MTIDEFKEKIAPHMKKGYVAMDKDNTWCYFTKKPLTYEKATVWFPDVNDEDIILSMFNIEPVRDWTRSLIKVGQ